MWWDLNELAALMRILVSGGLWLWDLLRAVVLR
jgi:hypothetical protein